MIDTILYDGEYIQITDDPINDFKSLPDAPLFAKAFDYCTNTLDTIYSLVHRHHPKAIKPSLYICDKDEINAFADEKGRIVIFTSLISHLSATIGERYSDGRLRTYSILGPDKSGYDIREMVCVFAWRYVVLHELYHLWENHIEWSKKYRFNIDGKLVYKVNTIKDIKVIEDMITEKITVFSATWEKDKYQRCLTSQAKEMDADSCAVNMLINLMMEDFNNRIAKGYSLDKMEYVRNRSTMLLAALASTFSSFDDELGKLYSEKTGAKFGMLKDNRIYFRSHPFASIRMIYAQEIMCAALGMYFPESKALEDIYGSWLTFDTDLESDIANNISWKNVFYYPAYTRKAQDHLVAIKRRMLEMYDTIGELAIGNRPKKLTEDEIKYPEEIILFDENGESLRGWK